MVPFKTRAELAEMSLQVLKASSAPNQLTPQQEALAKELGMRHGNIRVTREVHGLHFYLACPHCLRDEGEDELWKMHLAINVDKYLNGHTGAAQCMKTGETFMIDELTMWTPLSERGYDAGPAKIIDQAAVNTEFLEPDEKGRMVPKSPGETFPLTKLPAGHPAIDYLNSRGFSARDLVKHFNASYCYKEREDIKYRKLLGGFRATPQGRIVFEIRQNGVKVGWQARILEIADIQRLYYFHPYRDVWMPVMYRDNPQCDWSPLEGWEDWDPAKYIAAHGMRRNSCLMGYDAARAFRAARPGRKSFCFLCEGPLDAARIGPPAIALCGKSCSQAQADMLKNIFDAIIVVPDNDLAGSKLHQYVEAWIQDSRRVFKVNPPAHRKDAGAMTPDEVKLFRIGAMLLAAIN